ncbi:glycosyltransferase [Coraliomargarita sp. SDUM461004]|uniref:Glycosyltransferase n=1 Tax=Thalassobacterium sedimentorum TaxID=3041258 RepID=A0ABU1AF63_9BACT|nr:glycosyltransferase [Coraliomargarita sp. SDUM461004]
MFPRWSEDSTPPFVQNQCELMAREGWEVTVLAPHSSGAAFRETVAGVQVRRYPYAFPFALEKLCYEGGMLINLQARPWTKLLLPLMYIAQLLALLLICLRAKPDLLHSHSLLPQGLSACWVARLLGIPHVTTSHGNDVFGLKQTGGMGRLKRSVIRDADAITVNSSATQAAVVALGAAAEKVHLIPAVANVGVVQTEIVERIGAKYGQGPKVLFVGRFIEEKGVLDLLRAFSKMNEQVEDLQCLFVGDGVLREEMETLARDLKIESSVHFVGWRPGEEIASWMAAADVLVVPSWREAQGLVVVEAMSVATPVIASRVGGLPDLVIDRETGRLFEAEDVSSLADLLVNAFINRSESECMAQAAQARVEAYYSPDAVARQTEDLYQRFLKH